MPHLPRRFRRRHDQKSPIVSVPTTPLIEEGTTTTEETSKVARLVSIYSYCRKKDDNDNNTLHLLSDLSLNSNNCFENSTTTAIESIREGKCSAKSVGDPGGRESNNKNNRSIKGAKSIRASLSKSALVRTISENIGKITTAYRTNATKNTEHHNSSDSPQSTIIIANSLSSCGTATNTTGSPSNKNKLTTKKSKNKFKLGSRFSETIFISTNNKNSIKRLGNQREENIEYRNMAEQAQNSQLQLQQSNCDDGQTQRKRSKSSQATTSHSVDPSLLTSNSSQNSSADSVMGGNCKYLPPWSAERILCKERMRQEEKQCNTKNAHTMQQVEEPCNERKKTAANSTTNKNSNSVIQEQDWWRMTTEEGSDYETATPSGDDDCDKQISNDANRNNGEGNNVGRGDENNDAASTSRHLLLCAIPSAHSSDSSCSSLSLCESSSNPTTSNEDKKRRRRRKKNTTKKYFWNVGFSTWEASRAEWKNYSNSEYPSSLSKDDASMTMNTTTCIQNNITSSTNPPPSSHCSNSIVSSSQDSHQNHRPLTSIQYQELIKGLTGVSRQYELPKQMSLVELIGVYVDIWECDE